MSTASPCGSHCEPHTTCGTKKSRAQRARLRYWPREAATITFQEGLLNVRATGGGGQMRNANAQRTVIMGCDLALQQAPEPHVSHAETGGSCSHCYEGQRCA